MFQSNKLLKSLCTLGIGGPARYFKEVHSVEEMRAALLACRQQQLRYMILGKGSNCLFDDRGFDGVVILNKIDFFDELSPGLYHVGAGYSFSLLGTQTARKGYSGLEFASGIPASIGGAVFMNAGANGRETCEALQSVDFMHEDGTTQLFKREELTFSYRHSPFQQMRGAIIGATFQLTSCSSARAKQLEIITYRTRTQPYGEKSAGCIFRNPSCGHAGALIDSVGLKGTTIGRAKVSEMHANFLINMDNATARDMHALIEKVRQEVQVKAGVDLESEVRFISFNLDSAVQGAKAMQDFESEALGMGADHSQKVKAAPIPSVYGSKDWVDLASSTDESRFKDQHE